MNYIFNNASNNTVDCLSLPLYLLLYVLQFWLVEFGCG